MNIQCPSDEDTFAINPKLVGECNGVSITLAGVPTTALLDTGSTASTVSRTFYGKYLSHLPLSPIKDILDIECTGGQSLPYDGFVETDLFVSIPGMNDAIHSLFLVVPDSRYNASVPVLVTEGFHVSALVCDIPLYSSTEQEPLSW